MEFDDALRYMQGRLRLGVKLGNNRFLALLERLGPEARAAFLLREVFDADYAEVARALGKSEAACRQIVSCAKAQLKDAHPRAAQPREATAHRAGMGGGRGQAVGSSKAMRT